MKSTLISIVAVMVLAGATFAGPIHDAAKNGDLAGVQAELDKGVDVNAKDTDGFVPIDWAETPGIVNLLRKHGGKTSAELALMPLLKYGKNSWPFDFNFTTKKGRTYVVEVTLDFKQWGELKTIEGTGSRVKFIDSRNTAEILLQQHTAKHGGFGIRTWAADGGDLKSFDETKGQYEILSPPEFAERFDLDYPVKQYYRVTTE